MRLLAMLDPRRSLGVALAWLVLALSLGLAGVAGIWAGGMAQEALMARQRQHLGNAADQVAAELSQGIVLRQQALRAAAAILGPQLARRNTAALEQVLQDLGRAFPELLSITVLDRDAGVLARVAAPDQDGGRLAGRFIALTAPIRDPSGAELGALVARLDWDWAGRLAGAVDAGLLPDRGEEWMLVDEAGIVRLGSVERVGRPPPAGTDYLHALARPAASAALRGIGWRVEVIQPEALAARGAQRMAWRIFAALLGLGLFGAALALPLAQRLSGRVARIADSADRMLAEGGGGRIEVPPGRDEANRLGLALDRLLTALGRERAELARLNAELDARVAARTREVERLAEEARYAAQVRERLKLARDLHDTLGHSMMAMVAEIRLLKRFAKSDPAALAGELEQAEEAARQGLDEVRAAIAQMRCNATRDVGLGSALGDFLKRFRERTGIAVEYRCDAAAGRYAEIRAEALFRIAEEALRNVERHAGARKVAVSLVDAPEIEGLRLTIADDGCGFDPEAPRPGHFGLVGVREQAAEIGAELALRSAPGAGCVLEVALRTAPDLRD